MKKVAVWVVLLLSIASCGEPPATKDEQAPTAADAAAPEVPEEMASPSDSNQSEVRFEEVAEDWVKQFDQAMSEVMRAAEGQGTQTNKEKGR